MEEQGVWRTIRGRRIFIADGEDLESAMNRSGKFNNEDVQKQHNDKLKELKSSKYEDGTYDLNTMKAVDFKDGYQATFCQTSDNYNAKEYKEKVDEMLKQSSDGVAYAGKFGGEPEVSFHFKDLETAVKIMEKYNQVSIWDWKFQTEIKNQKYETGKGNDY